MKVCIFVMNSCTNDSRVLRHAQTFTRAGHETTIVAIRQGDSSEFEQQDGFTIQRVPTGDLTWREGYPQLFGRLPVRRSRQEPRDDATTPEIAPTSGRRLAPYEWVRWVLLGRGSAPRAWRGGNATLWLRLTFVWRLALSIARFPTRRLLHATKRQRRRITRRARWLSRHWLYDHTQLRQLQGRLARAGIELHADLYWANDTNTLEAANACARATGSPFVYDVHDVLWESPRFGEATKRAWRKREAKHIHRASRVYTVCEPIARMLATTYRIPMPTVLYNAPFLAETSAAQGSPERPLERFRRPGERLVMFHGGLAPHRGIEELIEAMTYLPEDFRLVLLGYGKLRPQLEELVRVRALEPRVTFLDAVPPSDLGRWLLGADVGAIPYLARGKNHEWSTPNKLFEYMHAGVPIVGSDLPEIRRIATDVGYGAITDCSEPKRIADAIAELTRDEPRSAAMRAAALEGAKRYCWEAQEASILSALGAG